MNNAVEQVDLNAIETVLKTQVSIAEESRAKVVRLEQELLKMPQAQIPVEHYFSRNVYAREMRCPADSVIVGRIHKFSQVNILSKGKVSVLTDDGLLTVSAPYTFVAQPGSKRAFYVHEDCVWTTVCGTDHTDLETIEDELTVGSYEEFKEFVALGNEKGEMKCLSSQQQ